MSRTAGSNVAHQSDLCDGLRDGIAKLAEEVPRTRTGVSVLAVAVTGLAEGAVTPAHDAVVREQRTGVAAAGGDLEHLPEVADEARLPGVLRGTVAEWPNSSSPQHRTVWLVRSAQLWFSLAVTAVTPVSPLTLLGKSESSFSWQAQLAVAVCAPALTVPPRMRAQVSSPPRRHLHHVRKQDPNRH